MKITRHSFGTTRGGRPVTLFRMENRGGAVVEALDYGCVIRSIRVPDRGGRLVDVVLGYDTLAEYEANDGYLGAVIGRYANRLGNAAFELNHKTYHLAKNDGPNHLHGGVAGFDRQVWDARPGPESVTFARCSPDGEEGYPGALYVRVCYTFSDDNALTISYEATPDADTIVNLTNHAYFNLAGGGTVLDEELTIHADAFTQTQFGCLPTGRILPVEGTPLDFRTPKPIGRDLFCGDEQLSCVGGYDHNFVLGQIADTPVPAAQLYAPSTGVCMLCKTTLPGLQLYTANCLSPRAGKEGAVYEAHAGVCLETQFYPDAPAHNDFPSPVLRKGAVYRQQTQYAFVVK